MEDDFKNGYYLGELLKKYNQQLDFQKFENKLRKFIYCFVFVGISGQVE